MVSLAKESHVVLLFFHGTMDLLRSLLVQDGLGDLREYNN